MEIEDVAQFISEAIDDAPVSFEPWKHLYVENVFPEDFYREIEISFAKSEHLFQQQIHTGDKDLFTAPYHKRSEFRISNDSELRRDQGEVWDTVWKVLNSQTFFIAMKRSFGEDLMVRFDGYFTHPKFRENLDPWLIAAKHELGYHLGPHTDRSEKVITCIFNIAEGDEPDEIGTALYLPSQRDFKSNGRQHFDFKKFERVKTSPYRRNSALFFPRQDASFHGVEPLTEANLKTSARRNLQFNLFDWGNRSD
jgi:hypothetical protein